MTISISQVLEVTSNKIASHTDEHVIFGTPDESKPGLCIFPYMLSENPELRNLSARDAAVTRDAGYIIRCLLISNSPNDYAALDKGLRGVVENPIIALKETKLTVSISSITTEDLTNIFRSAGITLRLAIPFELKWT